MPNDSKLKFLYLCKFNLSNSSNLKNISRHNMEYKFMEEFTKIKLFLLSQKDDRCHLIDVDNKFDLLYLLFNTQNSKCCGSSVIDIITDKIQKFNIYSIESQSNLYLTSTFELLKSFKILVFTYFAYLLGSFKLPNDAIEYLCYMSTILDNNLKMYTDIVNDLLKTSVELDEIMNEQ